MTDKIYTVIEVSEILKVTPSTVRRYIREGSIKAFKLLDNPSAGYRITAKEVKKLTENVTSREI